MNALLECFDLLGGWVVIMRNCMQFFMSISLREILRIILEIIDGKNFSIMLSTVLLNAGASSRMAIILS